MQRTNFLISLLVVLALCSPASGAPILVGFPSTEARVARAEFLNYDRLRQAMLQQDLSADLLAMPFRAAELKQFNVVLFQIPNELNESRMDDGRVQATIAAQRTALGNYVRDGGGLVIIVQANRYPGGITEPYFTELFKDFGIRLLHESIWDPSTAFTARGTPSHHAEEFFKTTNIKPHPVTEGVTRLCLPRSCDPVIYGPEWSTVVSGEATAKSATYPSAPPIVAVRDFGKGRLVVCCVPPLYSVLNYDNPLWPQIFEKNGDVRKHEPSFGGRLLFNSLRWAGTRSQSIAGFGGREIPRIVDRVQYPATMHVDPTRYVPAPGTSPAPHRAPHRGIIGAHTAYSDGQGTIREWADAALASGLDFLVISENLDKLSPENWAALVRDCATISHEGRIYLCPGYEYSDINDCRWAIWGEKVVYPNARDFGPDGKKIFRDGHVDFNSHFAARMLLTYDKLPGDAANLWWFYRVPIFVYDEDKLIADQTRWYLFGLENLDQLSVCCFTRIHAPQSVSGAAGRCTLNFNRAVTAREELDTSAASFAKSYVSQGGAQGPQVEIFAAANDQADANLYVTAGAQRARLYFRAYAPAGLREINIYDGARGGARRFLPRGANDYWREFEMTHDRQHELVLEAIDMQGRRALWSEVRLWSYKQGLFRCGDNLNLLSSTPCLAHPDRHEVLHWPCFEDWELLTLQGFDTGSGVLTQPAGHLGALRINTTVGSQGEYNVPKQPFDGGARAMQSPARFPLASGEISIWEVLQERYVKFLGGDVAQGPFLPVAEELPFATVRRRVYMLRSRENYYTTWDHRRPHEGAEAYQGDIFVHDGVIKFKQDVTLRGEIPISMEQLNLNGGSAFGLADTFTVTDAVRGRVQLKFSGKKLSAGGVISKGGYIFGGPTDAGILALVPDMEGVRYELSTSSADPNATAWEIHLGVGKDGQRFKQGEELPFRYLCAAIPSRVKDPEAALQRFAASYGLTVVGYPFQVEVGELESTDVFFTARSRNREFEATFGSWPLLLNRPFRIRGLEENGTAAIYVLRGNHDQSRFRFVPVFKGDAYFQQNLDQGGQFWAGNVFYCDNPALKLTMVVDGLTDKETPFLDIHNPTGAAITTTIKSPPHTPRFGGFSKQVVVPPGDSMRVNLAGDGLSLSRKASGPLTAICREQPPR